MNVLLIQADQQRRDSIAAHGNRVTKTPHIDSLCRDGVVFDNAFTPAPICAPARASLITGKRPVHHGIYFNRESGSVGGRDFVGGHATLGELLREGGCCSTICGKWHVGSELQPSKCGFEGVFYPGYGYPEDHPHYLQYLERLGCSFDLKRKFTGRPSDGSRGLLLSAVQDGSVEASVPYYLVEQALEAIRRSADKGEPFFIRCDFWGPHAPYIIPEPYASMYDPGEIPQWPNFEDSLEGKPSIQHTMKDYWGVGDFSWKDWSHLVAMCYGYVSLIDDQVGRLLSAIDEAGLKEETAVFYTSDHGGMVGAHGLCDKGPHMYDEECRIPLIARVPGVAGGRRVDAHVYNMDLMPTILDLVGCGVPDGLDSFSLVPLLRGEEERTREAVAFIEFHGHQGPYAQRLVRTPEAKYVFNAPDVDELYDLERDPGELQNVIGHEAYGPLLRHLREHLSKHIETTGDPIRRFYEGTRMGR